MDSYVALAGDDVDMGSFPLEEGLNRRGVRSGQGQSRPAAAAPGDQYQESTTYPLGLQVPRRRDFLSQAQQDSVGLGGSGVDGEGQHAGCFLRLQFGPRAVSVTVSPWGSIWS